MASRSSRHGKRKVAKSTKKGRSNLGMQDEDDFEPDDVSPTAKLMLGFASEAKRNPRPRRRFGLYIGLLIAGCLLVIAVAGVLAWQIHIAHSPTSVKPQPDPDPAYGISTDSVFLQHRPPSLSAQSLRQVSNAVNVQDLKARELNPLLIPRVAGTPGSQQARTHIVNQLESLGGWNIELDAFEDSTPFGVRSFTNVVATANPGVKRRLVLACHYDSKYFPAESSGQVFIGATDSALPCAQMIYLACSLDSALKQANNTNPPVTLQLIFFDGEEAFVRWTSTDSIYGSRNLAAKMSRTPHPPGATRTNLLHGIDMFVLLDLLGARNPSIPNYFQSTTTWYQRLADIEQRLKRSSLTTRYTNNYFNGQQRFGGGIEDDHIPFLNRGVRVLHLIPSRFPSVWHTMRDNAAALDDNTISNLSKILHVFVAEYLSLPV